MSIKPVTAWLSGVALALAVAVPAVASAASEERAQVAGDMKVYLGVMSADAIQAQPALHVEEEMHGGIPDGENIYHVLITLFDRETGERIEDAAITARVTPLGLGGSAHTLEVMYSAGVVCYCNWFEMADGQTYRISVLIDRPGKPVRRTQFEYTPD